MEFLVDYKSVKMAPDGDMVGAWIRMYKQNDDLFYKPRLYNYLVNDHPSIYHRIINLNK